MKNDNNSSSDEDVLAGSGQFQFSYGELLQMAKERQLSELERKYPDEAKKIANNAGNITRAIRAFMKANDILRQDPIGMEMLEQTAFERANDRLGPTKTSQKSLVRKARTWVLEEYRVKNGEYNHETFGMRLARLRVLQQLNYQGLASRISTSSHRTDWTVLRNWENGNRRPAPESIQTIQRLEKVLNVPPGSLVEKMPKEPSHSRSADIDLPRSLKRRVSQHLPSDFGSRSDSEKEEILTWVADNILSSPKEIFDDGSFSSSATEDVFYFALSRTSGRRTKMASPQLLNELDEIGRYKTASIPPFGMKRNSSWSQVTQSKMDYDLRAFFGALDLLGLPTRSQSISIFLAPEAIERFISWRHERRGAYTGTLINLLKAISSFVHPKFGFIVQKPNYGRTLVEIPGFVSSATARLAKRDWYAACLKAHEEINGRIKQIEKVAEKGRDAFEALTPAINDHQQFPLFEYMKIAAEIRARIPGPEYPVRHAEAQRALMILMIGLTTALRRKNLRELLICLPGNEPRSQKELRRLNKGEMFWRDDQWWIAIPREAFKNGGTRMQPGSSAIEDWNQFPIENVDGKLYSDIQTYLQARQILLGGYDDPGNFFVKTMASRALNPEYSSQNFYDAFRRVITTYGIYNPYTKRGALKGLKPHGPHSMRHVIATHLVKNGSIDDAAAALFDSPITIMVHYGRYRPGEKHRDAMRRVWAGWRQFRGERA